MYNLKVTKFPSGVTRVQYYEYVVSPSEKEKKSEKLVENPFNSDLVREVEQFPDHSHSLCESLRRTRAMVYNYSLANDWDWFVTLTFDPQKVDRYNYSDCAKKLKNFIDVTRRKCPGLKYLFVPELHKDGAFHFHGLIACCDGLAFTDPGVKHGSRKVYNIPGYRYGFSTATRVSDFRRAGTYLSKYLTKELCQVSSGRKRYWASRNLELPAVEKVVVEFYAARERILDEIYDVSSYYKRLVSPDQERISHFYEFPPDVDIGIRNFMPWVYSA